MDSNDGNSRERKCRRFRITGRVQGVFFRDSTRQTARNLELTGYARNMPDGSVEVLGCGSAEALDELESWLQHGPRTAKVANVESTAVKTACPPTFSVG